MAKKEQERAGRLFELGFKYNGTELFTETMNVHWTDLVCWSDEEFDRKFKLFEVRRKEELKTTN